MRTSISDMLLLADAIESLAFKMPAPNPYTPQFVQIAITARNLAQQADNRRREQVGLPINAEERGHEHHGS